MKYKRISIALVSLLLLGIACQQQKNAVDEIFDLLNRLEYKKGENIIVNVINPGDCQTCIAVGKLYYEELFSKSTIPRSNIFFVIPKIRKIEKDILFKERFILPTQIKDCNIITDNNLQKKLISLIPNKNFYSFVIVYNPRKELMFCKQIKDPTFMEAIKPYIK